MYDFRVISSLQPFLSPPHCNISRRPLTDNAVVHFHPRHVGHAISTQLSCSYKDAFGTVLSHAAVSFSDIRGIADVVYQCRYRSHCQCQSIIFF